MKRSHQATLLVGIGLDARAIAAYARELIGQAPPEADAATWNAAAKTILDAGTALGTSIREPLATLDRELAKGRGLAMNQSVVYPRVLFTDTRVRIVQKREFHEARPTDCLTLERREQDAMGGSRWVAVSTYGTLDADTVDGVLAVAVAKSALADLDRPDRDLVALSLTLDAFAAEFQIAFRERQSVESKWRIVAASLGQQIHDQLVTEDGLRATGVDVRAVADTRRRAVALLRALTILGAFGTPPAPGEPA